VPQVTKKTLLARTLTLGLWGFVPLHIAEVVHQRNVWNWRKLLVCGESNIHTYIHTYIHVQYLVAYNNTSDDVLVIEIRELI
jgi:hypothetical protein